MLHCSSRPVPASYWQPLSAAGICNLNLRSIVLKPQDGYAVVAADGAGTYPVVGEARTGDLGTVSVNPGAVAYITTGKAVSFLPHIDTW